MQINGIIMMLDMSGMTWNHAKNFTPFAAKRMLSILQVLTKLQPGFLNQAYYPLLSKCEFLVNFVMWPRLSIEILPLNIPYSCLEFDQ